MQLSKAKAHWPLVAWTELRNEVEETITRLGTEKLRSQLEMRKLRGKIDWQGDLDEMRRDK